MEGWRHDQMPGRASTTNASGGGRASASATSRRRSWSSTPPCVFHAEADPELDPVTYEVIRTKLWNLNADHSDTIRRVSGSYIVVEGYDFNSAVTTEIGDAVTLSPYSMLFAGLADSVIKWTLEHRSMNVGIHDGDLFIQDDPWVGAEPSNGHRHLRAGLCRRTGVRLAVQLLPSARDRRRRPGRLRPGRHRRLHRGVVHAADQAGRKRS